MREVGFPQNSIDADKLAHFDADGLKPEIDVNLPPKHLARPERDTLSPQLPCFPLRIARLEHGAHPTQACFGKDPVQARKALEHPGKNEKRDDLRCGAKIP